MAQLKVISNARPNKNKAGGSRSREDSLKYGFGEDNDRAVAVSSTGCTGTTWQEFVSAFAATCAAHGKKPKTEIYHLEQSFGDELDRMRQEDIERANQLGLKSARAMWPGRQVVVVTQIDGKSGYIHNHIFVNNPHPITGLMCRGNDMTWERLMPIHDATLAAAGYVQPDVMPTSVNEAKARAQETRQRVQAEGRAHLETILAAAPASIEAANAVAPEGVQLIDEPWELRAKRGRRPDHGRRMRIKFTGSDGRPHAFDIARTGITYEQITTAFEANRAAPPVVQPVPVPVSAPAPTDQAEEPAPITAEEFYRLVMGDDSDVVSPTSAPAPVGGQASAPAPAMPSTEPVDDSMMAPPVSAPAPTEEVVAGAPALAPTDLSPNVVTPGPLPTTDGHGWATDGPHRADVGAVVAADAPTTPTSGPSVAASGQDRVDQQKPYVSPLRKLKFKKADPKRQQLIDGLASFDEETRARLAEGLRPIEAHIPKGVGCRVLGSLGSHLDPAVRAQLELRETKKRARSTAFETGRDLTAQLAAMRSQGKQHGDEFGQTEVMRDVANRHRARLEYELDAGCYEDVDEALTTWKAEHPQVAKFSATDREDYVQRGHIALEEALEQAQRDRQGGD